MPAKALKEIDSTSRSGVLAQLSTPLSFFGLSLLVIEGTFGAVLVTSSLSEKVVMIILLAMVALFLVSIVAVSCLTYLVPSHIMLKPQQRPFRSAAELASVNERVEQATDKLRELSNSPPKNAAALRKGLEEVRSMLSHESS
jgi:hypothetical protein